MDDLSLSISEANRLVMVKNHLLRHSGKGSLVGVADDLCGLHLNTLQTRDREDSSVHFLSYEDPYTKGFKLKQRLIDRNFDRIAYPMGGALPTLLVDGRIVGTWSITIADHVLRLLVRKFVPLERITIEKVREEGQRLGRFLRREMASEVTIEGDKRWRQIIATSRPSYYVTGTPRQKET